MILIRVSQRVAQRLRAIPFFAQIRDEAKLRTLSSLFAFEEHASGAVLCRQGDDADKFYIIIRGAVQCYVRAAAATVVNESSDNEGRSGSGGADSPLAGLTLVSQIGKDGWFGEIALLQDTPRTATVIVADPATLSASALKQLGLLSATGDGGNGSTAGATASDSACVLCSITKERFATFLSLAPELAAAFAHLLAQRTAATMATLAVFADTLLALRPQTQTPQTVTAAAAEDEDDDLARLSRVTTSENDSSSTAAEGGAGATVTAVKPALAPISSSAIVSFALSTDAAAGAGARGRGGKPPMHGANMTRRKSLGGGGSGAGDRGTSRTKQRDGHQQHQKSGSVANRIKATAAVESSQLVELAALFRFEVC
jgi:CRP-like cAMP-binding protein